MNAAQDRYRPPQIKASDADRDAVVAVLSEHFQAGRLTTEELEERTGQALAARTLGQLDELTTDLPASHPAAPPVPDTPRRPGYLVMMPLIVPVAVLAILAAVLATSTGVHGWGGWWVIPVGLLIARRLAGRRDIRRTSGTTSGGIINHRALISLMMVHKHRPARERVHEPSGHRL